MEKIIDILNHIVEEKSLIKMVLGSPRKKSLPYTKVVIRPITMKGDFYYQVEYHYKNKVLHENLKSEDMVAQSLDFMMMDFKQMNLFTVSEDIQILAANPGDPKILRSKPTKKEVSLEHNATKNYLIPNGVPCDFLIRLGVSDEKGKVYQKHYNKFRQINRYLEIVEDSFSHLDTSKPLRIVDFGCGKSYLTFALYHYFWVIKGQEVEIVGLDLKEEVINFCNMIAGELGYSKLKFILGDIAHYTNDHADMVVSLHACDTATDYALMNAVQWGSQIILSVPCCQHELFDQIKEPVHQAIFRHGLLKDRFTEILTDGVRGLKLEAAGYDVSMIEFTSLEHTSKNIMIKAVKGKTSKKARDAQAAYKSLKSYWNINPTIDKL
jgi:SAM-dependent methyltransferase